MKQKLSARALKRAIMDALTKGAVGVETSTANPDARRFYERHNFKQFMGEWKMGEIFLELDMKKKTKISNLHSNRRQTKVQE